MKKRKLYVFMSLILFVFSCLSYSIAAQGMSPQSSIIRVMVDGEFIQFEDVPPQMVGDRLLVPVRGVFEHMGFIVNWISHSRRATLTSGDFFIVIPADADYFVVNGIPFTPDVPQQLINGRLMLPLRAIAEAVGGTADWDRYNQVAIISTRTAGDNQFTAPTPSPTPTLTAIPTPAPPISTPSPTPSGNELTLAPTVFDELTLLTSAEILELVENAPSHFDTRSSVILPNRMLTQSELDAWIEEYRNLGGINAYELEIIRLINEERIRHGLNPMAISPELSMAARFHSQEQVDLGFFGHVSPVTGRGTQRAEMFGHTNIQEHVFGIGENIGGTATSQRTPEDQVNAWLNSPGHRAAILRGDDVTQAISIGVGRVGGITTAKFGS